VIGFNNGSTGYGVIVTTDDIRINGIYKYTSRFKIMSSYKDANNRSVNRIGDININYDLQFFMKGRHTGFEGKKVYLRKLDTISHPFIDTTKENNDNKWKIQKENDNVSTTLDKCYTDAL
jgi:hypothetical protein